MIVFIFQAALLCNHCGLIARTQTFISEDSDRFPQGPYPNGGGEADSPQHCDYCNVFLENALTSDGEKYVRDTLAGSTGGSLVQAEWRGFYGYLFD